MRRPTINRFVNKGLYDTADRSLFHKFLKEEGYNRKFLSIDLNLSVATIDKYLQQPHLFNVQHIKAISEETGVDANFLIDIIYESNNTARNSRQ